MSFESVGFDAGGVQFMYTTTMNASNDQSGMDACRRCGYQFSGVGDAVRHYYTGERRERREQCEADHDS